jgi:hypothetical protein
MKTESLTTRNLQLEVELSAIKEDSTGYTDTIMILQEAKRKLEDENQRLIQSSMDAQADVCLCLFCCDCVIQSMLLAVKYS